MKRIIYTFVAALALVACTPDNGVSNKVRIAVSFEEEQQNSKGQQRISAVDNGSIIEVKWEEEDLLYYEENESNKFFSVANISNDGKIAIFECNDFKGDPQNFSLYYNTTRELSLTQTVELKEENNQYNYVLNPEYLSYVANNCKIGHGIHLEPNFMIFGVRLQGDINDFSESVVIGKAFNDFEGAYLSHFSDKVDLNNQPIYYFILPNDANFLQDKHVWFNSGDRINNKSYALSLDGVTLDNKKAQIVTIKVETYVPSENEARWCIYRLSNNSTSVPAKQ